MKKMICILIAMMILLTACGQNNAEKPGQVSETEVEEPANTELPKPVRPYETGEVEEADFQVNDLGDGMCELRGCTADLKTIVVPETIQNMTVIGVGNGAFIGCSAETVTLPDTVQYIDKTAFNSCYKLKTINLGSGLQWVEKYSFSFCTALESLTFPEGMKEIRECCFMSCPELKEVVIPASVTEIYGTITKGDTCPNIVIVTPAGSAAEAMALEREIPVVNQ